MEMPVVSLLTLVLAMGLCTAAFAADGPLELGPGPQLFIDDYLIAESHNLVRTTHQPDKLPEPILPKAEPWHEWPLSFLKVIHYPDEGRFRMWYNIRNNTAGMPGTCYALAESEDGIHWRRPNLGLVEVGGSKDNNLYMLVSALGLGFLAEGPGFADPARRSNLVVSSRRLWARTWEVGEARCWHL